VRVCAPPLTPCELDYRLSVLVAMRQNLTL